MSYCLITNDVETTSILNHMLRDETGRYVRDEGMPRLLDLYDRYGVQATFFYTGHIARLYPEVVRMAHERGHEVGSHGLTHEVSQAFDILTPEEQLAHLRQSKQILEDIIGEEVVSFRAPAARVDKQFPQVLHEAGFLIVSSVSSQRLDMMFSFGALKKLHWITAPRKAYYADPHNIFRKGGSDILEIPISAIGFPYIGTFMRIAPALNRMTRRLLYAETLCTGRQFVFLTHPNDFAGRIGVLEELEHTYRLTVGIASHEPQRLMEQVDSWLADPDLYNTFAERRQRMLADKIDVAAYFTWFIEHYPQSRNMEWTSQ